ncbi:hypothetical protein OIDMADRAFT_16267 [Oidiodendron maius Zn]|uniref:Uncharacterized protein n=1 Tax=Oidiodendron maius (strain Zn) TaxID=913774 RepID=A0A0C3HXU2_OIDMZ|nr:hypothetical protein OIDMADRAFT_16267 [Oidiodendron maius Zn]
MVLSRLARDPLYVSAISPHFTLVDTEYNKISPFSVSIELDIRHLSLCTSKSSSEVGLRFTVSDKGSSILIG